MDIDKELEDLFSDPLMDVSYREAKLFDIPSDMKVAMETHKVSPDYVAKRKVCDDFQQFEALFLQVHKDLKIGHRQLKRISKTTNIMEGHFYIVDGQMIFLARVFEIVKGSNGSLDGRTRCIYENGTESDILLQTLRKNVVGNGYAITETQEETNSKFFSQNDVKAEDKVTGYVYVLRSLSTNPEIRNIKDLYKIGFSTNRVEQRVANAEHEPTYLMAPVEIVGSYKIVNMHSHKFEDLIHQVLKEVNFRFKVTDDMGIIHEATEWYQVPLEIIDCVIQRIMDGSIVYYSYNRQLQCLEQNVKERLSKLDLSSMNVLTLNVDKKIFELIASGEIKEECCELKQTTLNKYTYIDEADGKRYLRRFDVLRLRAGNRANCMSAVVKVLDTSFADGIITYQLGDVLEVIRGDY